MSIGTILLKTFNNFTDFQSAWGLVHLPKVFLFANHTSYLYGLRVCIINSKNGEAAALLCLIPRYAHVLYTVETKQPMKEINQKGLNTLTIFQHGEVTITAFQTLLLCSVW